MDSSLLMITLGSWVYFLAHKDKTLHTFIRHCKKVQNEKGLTPINVRSDHGGEFENHGFESFCKDMVMAIIFLLLELPNKMGL